MFKSHKAQNCVPYRGFAEIRIKNQIALHPGVFSDYNVLV